jgi:tetratricopeptide (TPR) repeat protein
MVVVTGGEGSGKTALALKVVHDLVGAGRFKDMVAFVDLEAGDAGSGAKTTVEAMQVLLRPLVGVELQLPEDLAALRRLWWERTAGREMLMFLDNVQDEEQIRPLLPRHPGCSVLITSRRPLAAGGLDAGIELGPMTVSEGTSLALAVGNRVRPDRMSESQAASIATLCAGQPLTIRVVAASLAASDKVKIAPYVAALAERVRPLSKTGQQKDLLAASLALLDERTLRRWRHLAVFEGGFDAAAAAAIWMVDDARETLAQLERRALVDSAASGRVRYRLTSTLRELAAAEMKADPSRLEAASRRHAFHYLAVLGLAEDLCRGGSHQVADGLWLYHAERRNIAAGQAWATARLDQPEAAQLAADYAGTGSRVMDLCLQPKERIGWFEAQIEASRRLGDRAAEAAALGELGITYQDLNEAGPAIENLKQRLTLTRELGDRAGEGKTLGHLGCIYVDLGQFGRALDQFERALPIAREVGDRCGETIVGHNMAEAYWRLGRRAEAIAAARETLAVARAIESPFAEQLNTRLLTWSGKPG